MSNLLRFGMLFLVLVFSACGDDSKASNNNANNANNSADAGSDTSDVDDTPQLMCPNEGEIVCDGRCLNVQYSMDNCGGCNVSCTVGTMTCDEGMCQCLDGRTMCDNRCINTDNSREHCGGCDIECDISEACVSGSCSLISERSEVVGVLQHTNDVRSENQDCGENGPKRAVDGLQLNDLLMVAAQAHAEDMATNRFMAHEGSDGSSPSQRARRATYSGRLVGENVARGYRSPEAVVQGWLDSDGHCNNMMNGGYTEIGIGYAVSTEDEAFWVQLFGAP